MNANFDMAIFHVNTRPDYFCISGILITIALMCLSVIFLAHGAKLSGVAHSSAAFPSISDGNAPLMMHDEARGEAAMALSSSPIKAVREFGIYITANRTFIPNYGDRYRHGETISTAFVESAINQVVSKRMVKKQQMRWTDRGAHLLLQVRTRVLNEEWRSTLSHWYPAMQETCDAKAA